MKTSYFNKEVENNEKQNDMKSILILRFVLMMFLYFPATALLGQCPQLNDGTGTPSSTPYWIAPCNGLDYNLFVQSPDNIGTWTIDWGDGSAIDSGPDLIPPAFITHNYTAVVDTLIVVFTETSSGCVVQGVVVMERPVTAELGIPGGVSTQICAPDDISFVNNTNLTSGLQVSETTVFTWDYGDGSPIEVYDYTNLLQQVTHTYLPNTVNCETTVILTAENYCGLSTSTFNPIEIWDVDEADIDASQTLLCYPDTEVFFQNDPQKNCLPNNAVQRYEYWNFGDYWGLGTDSIIDWLPYDPPARAGYNIAYPGVGSYDVMLIDSNFCGPDTAYITINIVNAPTAGLSVVDDTVCVGENVTLVNGSGGGANSYSWNFDDGLGWITTGPGNQTHSYPVSGDYTVTVVANITGGTASCTDTATVNVNVLPSPVATIALTNNNGCDTMTTLFTDASFGAISWSWNFDNGNTSTVQNPPSQFYNAVGNYTVTLDVVSANGCPDNTSSVVNIFQLPVVSFTTANVCENQTALFTDGSTSAAGDPIISWFWDFDDGNTSTAQHPSNIYATGSTYDVSLFVSTAFCSNSDTVSITVEPNPIASFTEDATSGCTPLTVNFTNTSTGAVSYLWDYSDGANSTLQDPSHTFINSGTTDTIYTVQLVASTAFGCTDTASVNITIFPSATAGFIHNAVTGCAPMDVTFTNTSVGGISYNWDFGDGNGSTQTNATYTYINTTLFIEIYTAELAVQSSNGCVDTITDNITVYPELLIDFSAFPDSGCSPLEVTFPPAVGAVAWAWDFDDGGATSNLQTPTHTFSNSTTNNQTFNIQLIATSPFGCLDTAYNPVTVFPKPTAAISVGSSSGCHPLVVNFTNSSLGATTYLWNFGDATTSNSTSGLVSHTFTNTSSSSVIYNSNLIVQTPEGCSDTAYQDIEVYPEVTANFFRSDTAGCHPLTINFVEQTSGATAFSWDFDNGNLSINNAPSNTFTNTGVVDKIYSVELIGTSVFGCSDTAYKDILVYPKPTAQFSRSAVAGCHPFNITFTDLTQLATNYLWDLGDGTTPTTAGDVNHTYTNTTSSSIIYDVELIVESVNSCWDTVDYPVEVYPIVIAEFSNDTVGCSPVSGNFVNTSTNTTSYLWIFGDGSSGNGVVPTHNFTNNGMNDTTYTIQMIAASTFGCLDTAYGQVLVHPNPVAAFTANPMSQLYPATTVAVTNGTNAGNWQYDWTFGDGGVSTAQNPIDHVYATWGDYTINLVVQSQFCSDSTQQTIIIIPPVPIADFLGPQEGCRPVTVQFQNLSQYENTWLWDFGDGATSTEENPEHTYYNEGTYTVKLTITGDGGTDTEIQQSIIVVNVNAIAFFDYAPSEVVVPNQPVQFYNLSSNANTYLWDFGDGATSTEELPAHYYSEPGTYSIELIADNEFGCPDTFLVEEAVFAERSGEIVYPNAFTPNTSGGNGGVYDPRGYSNDVFFPVHDGVIEYKMSIYNRWGELIFESFDVNVGWDGYYLGLLSQQDVYVWKATGKYSNGNDFNEAGDLTLIR
ncbi:MAG: PKD domain-containing protein [Flavobacteriales bacterium]|nr:PKD domain-containing protein [Flavobacteriales bacterium]